MSDSVQLTPLMKQYFEIKGNFPDALLLFQVGDFYELFLDDAKKAASFLGIALTKRGNINGDPIALCGVPMHALEHYLIKLVKGGFKVAICNQLEEAVPGKVVKRGVVQVLTPGTLTDSKLLNEKSASYLFSFFPMNNSWGILFGELLTAQMFATLIPAQAFKVLETELARFFPDEILMPNNETAKELQTYFKNLGYFTTIQDINDDYEQVCTQTKSWIDDQSGSFLEISKHDSLLYAIHNFYSYLKKNQSSSVDQFKKVNFYKPDDFLILDAATQRNLELVKNNSDGSAKNSLFELLDKATTAMGARMIKKWIVRPLIKKESILHRQEAVEILTKNVILKEKLIALLSEISDLERIIGRIALNKAQFNDYLSLSNSLSLIPEVKKILHNEVHIEIFNSIGSKLVDLTILNNLLFASLNNDNSKSWLIKNGFDLKLDNLRDLAQNSDKKILELEAQEQISTNISSLKIRYNQMYGYYIEITKTNLDLVPARYIKQQSLSGKERFITPELQQLQIEIETARNEVNFIEKEIFEKIKNEVTKYIGVLRRISNALATLDALIGFANVAYQNGYVKPVFNDNRDIIIEDGRHPIIENVHKNNFISNSTSLTDSESLLIITGPNMGGKSTYLRQVALICILAQTGSFVPAKAANLPILDRVFSRIGSGDNLAEGKSTFLVEMEETAVICNQATNRSLVILDEVGRGTSTNDGLAIAQSVVEYIYQKVNARCLFATHYHELTELKNRFNGIASYCMASKKTDKGILFLHKLIPGAADSSFGLEVAKLAALPEQIIARSQEILHTMKTGDKVGKVDNFTPAKLSDEKIKNLEVKISEQNKVLDKIRSLNFDDITPKQAFDILWQIKSNP